MGLPISTLVEAVALLHSVIDDKRIDVNLRCRAIAVHAELKYQLGRAITGQTVPITTPPTEATPT
jgi:hypothetical protein